MSWFMKMVDFEKACGRVEYLNATRDKIQFDNLYEWCKEDPNVDNLRLDAVRAIEAYSNAIKRYRDRHGDEITDKMTEEETIINWKVLKKKLGRV